MKQSSTPSVIVADCEIIPIDEYPHANIESHETNVMQDKFPEGMKNSKGKGTVKIQSQLLTQDIINQVDYNQDYYKSNDKLLGDRGSDSGSEKKDFGHRKDSVKQQDAVVTGINSNLRLSTGFMNQQISPPQVYSTSMLSSMINNNNSVGVGDASYENVNFQDERLAAAGEDTNKRQGSKQSKRRDPLQNEESSSSRKAQDSHRHTNSLAIQEQQSHIHDGALASDRPLLQNSQHKSQQPLSSFSPHFTQDDRPAAHFVTNSISNPYQPQSTLQKQTTFSQVQNNTASTTTLSIHLNGREQGSETRVTEGKRKTASIIENTSQGGPSQIGHSTFAAMSTSQDSEELRNGKKKRGNSRQPRQANGYATSLTTTIQTNGSQGENGGQTSASGLTVPGAQQNKEASSAGLRPNRKSNRNQGATNQETFEKSYGSISILSRGMRNSEGNGAVSRPRRRDQFGTRIQRGSKRHKVCFADQLQSRDKLTQVFVVESYKKIYKRQMNNEEEDETNCNCCIF